MKRTFSEFSSSEKAEIAENIGEVLGISREDASVFINSELSEDEKQAVDDLDDFDFGDI